MLTEFIIRMFFAVLEEALIALIRTRLPQI
jgi:hypothetical protein